MPSARAIVACALPVLAASISPLKAAEVTLTSKITAVTIFPAGAEVTRAVHVKLDKGEVTAILPDLPASAVPGSLRVEGKSDAKLEIGAVDSRHLVVPRADQPATDAERKKLEDEIETVRDERTKLQGALQAAEQQKALIANLANLPTRPAPTTGSEAREDWAQVLGVISAGTETATRGAIDAGVKLRVVERRLHELERHLAEVAPVRTERTEVRVALAASAATEADLVVRYQVPSASWVPGYDARLATGTKAVAPKLELTRRATISQRTGEAWEDVAIELSTSRPSAGSSAPELTPVTVDFLLLLPPPPPSPVPMAMAPMAQSAPVSVGREAGLSGRMADKLDDDEPRRKMALAKGRAADRMEEAKEIPAQLESAPFQAVFAVPGRLSVPSTGDHKRVTLAVDTIEPALSVKATPKRDPKAFLYAKFTLPKGGAALLAGRVALFRDGTFSGTGQLPLVSAGEEHDLGFGADDNVRVKYSVIDEKRSETGLITTARNEAKSFKITIKNLHERPVAMSVLDQVPVSLNQDIKVELTGRTTPTKRDIDDKRGLIAFEGNLAPDEERALEFGYRISWPAPKAITYGN